MFDTVQVGRKIKDLRMKNNLTQMNLADLLGVSYQAVSNWERGNSMPDISKLSELSAAFHCTIDELLGNSRETELVKAAVEMEENGSVPVEVPDLDTLTHVAPVLKPDQTAKFVERIAKKPTSEDGFTLDKLVDIAPFLDEKMLDDLVTRAMENEGNLNIKNAIALAPFLSEQSLNRLAATLEGNLHDLVGLAPFLSQEALDGIIERADGNVKDLVPLAPFLSQQALNKLVLRSADQEVNDDNLTALAPFLDQETLDVLVDKLVAQGKSKTCRKLYPFLSSESLHKILEAILASGSTEELKKIAHFL